MMMMMMMMMMVLDKFGNTEGTIFYSPVQSCVYIVMPLCSVMSVLLFGLLVSSFIFIFIVIIIVQ